MRTEFYEIIPEVLRREGGFVDDPSDRGGATNWGVTIGTMQRHGIDVDGDGDVDREDVQLLSIARATEIYKQAFWDPARVDELPSPLRDLYFDMCVNHGQERAVRILQQAINIGGGDIAEDGLIGPETIRNAGLLTVQDVVYQRIYFYSMIIAADSSQMRFRAGWYNRALSFKE